MRSKIGFKLVILIILFSSLITLISSAISLYFNYQSDISRVSNYKKLIEDSYLNSITSSIWNFDDYQIKTQINGLLNLPDMEYIEIQSTEGAKWIAGSQRSKHYITYTFALSYRQKEDIIGNLKIVAGLDDIYERLLNRALMSLASNGLQTFLISGFIFLIFQFLVTRHLNSLSRWLKNVEIGKSFEKFQLSRNHHNDKNADELDEVVSAINLMQDNLRSYLQKLLVNEEKYKTLAENIPLQVYHKNVESIYVACNNKFAVALGLNADHISGKTDFDLFPKERANKYLSDDRRIISSKKIETFEEIFITPDGRESTVQTIKTPLWDENNTVIGLLGASIDITDFKMTQAALLESETRLGSLSDNIPGGMTYQIETDIEGKTRKFTYVSAGVEKLHEITVDAVLKDGRKLYDQIAEEDQPLFAAIEMKALKMMKPLDIEACFHLPSGKTRWSILSSAPRLSIDGKVLWDGVEIDITNRKKAEAEREQLQAQLVKSQRIESIGTLAGGIAHDFNNILFPIVGMAEMLLEDLPQDSREWENADEILKAGKRATDLVKQILTFSRRSEHKMIPTHVQTVLKEVLNLSRSTIPSIIDIDQDIQPNCGLIMADPTQIHQVAMNIITNAYHAVEEGGGKISVALKEKVLENSESPDTNLNPGKYAVLTVSDTGHGIPQDDMGKIFEPYFTTKKQGKGTGLGLAVVHGIIREHRGAIKVSSAVGKGTAFVVYFPLIEKTVEAESVPNDEINLAGDEQILMVDDEESIVKLGKIMLDRLGYQVTICTSAVEAINAFKANPDMFDLVISDMTMPNITGDQLARELITIRPDISIIICTGFSEKINQEEAEAIGVKGFLMKPIIKAEMSKMIRKVLDEAKN